MEKIKQNSRQVPKTDTICANKKYYDILYSYLQCISQERKDKTRYVMKKDIKFTKLADVFNLTRQTISTKFKNLISLGLVIDSGVDTYDLIKLDNDVAWLVQYDLLKLMTDALSENAISTYIYLYNRYYATKKPFQFTLEQIKKHIGICSTTRSNDDTITNILFVLQKLGVLQYSLTTMKQECDTFENVKTIYQLDWITNDIKDIKC